VHDIIHRRQAAVVPASDLSIAHRSASCGTSPFSRDRRTAEHIPRPVKHRNLPKKSRWPLP